MNVRGRAVQASSLHYWMVVVRYPKTGNPDFRVERAGAFTDCEFNMSKLSLRDPKKKQGQQVGSLAVIWELEEGVSRG